jgi:hypothetical protein
MTETTFDELITVRDVVDMHIHWCWCDLYKLQSNLVITFRENRLDDLIISLQKVKIKFREINRMAIFLTGDDMYNDDFLNLAKTCKSYQKYETLRDYIISEIDFNLKKKITKESSNNQKLIHDLYNANF